MLSETTSKGGTLTKRPSNKATFVNYVKTGEFTETQLSMWETWQDSRSDNEYTDGKTTVLFFFDDAYIATAWKQKSIDEFIEAAKEGFSKDSLSCLQNRSYGRWCGCSILRPKSKGHQGQRYVESQLRTLGVMYKYRSENLGCGRV